MSARRLLVLVLLVGLVCGSGAALVGRGDPAPAAAAPVAGTVGAPVQRVPLRPIGTVTIAVRADDLGGGTPWALRRFTARQSGDTFACVQLGRLDGDRFGWLAPGAPFRLARYDQLDVPTRCGDTFPRGLPQLSVAALTTDGSSGLPEPDRTIVWGTLPPGIVSARLGDGTELRAGGGRAVLAVLPARPLGALRLAGTLRTKNGTTRRFAYPTLDPSHGAVTRGRDGVIRPLRLAGGRPILARERLAARVPDPAGGAAWGITTTPSTRGATCFSSPARLVGDRLAAVDPRLGLASPAPFGAMFDCSERRAPSAARPLRMDVALMSIGDEDPAGSEQLRRLRGRTIVHGRTTAGVVAVTITTSRDIRTLVPDPRTHIVIAAYDGTFPGERLKITATLRDGRTRTVMQPSGA